MKKLFPFLASLLLLWGGVSGFAQEPKDTITTLDNRAQDIPMVEFKKDRYIYLWDVTWSMQGRGFKDPDTGKYTKYVKEADIYDLVVDEIVRDINSITDETTEIVVIPFQSGVANSYQSAKNPWIYKTASGPNKKELIERIRSSKKEWLKYSHDHTDIVPALKYVINSIISEDRIDYLKILTDGKMNDEKGLRELMAQWCQLAGRTNGMHAFYISLNKEASESIHEIMRNAQTQDCFKVIDPGHTHKILDFYQVLPYPAIAVNCNDLFASGSPSVRVQLQVKGPGKLPDTFKIQFEMEENPFLTIKNRIISVKDNFITLPVEFKMELNEMKRLFNNGMKAPVRVQLRAVDGDNIFLLADTVTLYLTVEKEKKMTLNWE